MSRIRMKGRIWVLLVAGVMCGCVSAYSATYYVATNGNDSWDGLADEFVSGSNGPWATLGHADGQMAAGDTLQVRGGTYDAGNGNRFYTNVDGTAANRITVQAYAGETPVVEDVSSTINDFVFSIDHNFWVIDGLTIGPSTRHMNIDGSVSSRVANCSFLAMTDTNDWAGVRLWKSSQYNIITNCTFTDWGHRKAWADTGTPLGIGNHSDDLDDTWYNLIVDCTFNHGGHDAMSLWSGYNVIRGNYFHNENWMEGGASPTKGFHDAYGNRMGEFGDNVGTQRDWRNVIESNRFHYSGMPPDEDWGGFGIEVATKECIYRHNSIAYTFAAGFYLSNGGQTNYVYHNVFYANTIDGNSMSNQPAYFKGGISMSNFQTNDHAGNVFANNIIWGNDYHDVHSSVSNSNIFLSNHVGDNGDADPLFISDGGRTDTGTPDYNDTLGINNFRINAGSPVIDQGDWLTTVTSADGSGTSFVVADAKFFSDGNNIVAGDTIQFEGETNRAVITSVNITNGTIDVDASMTWTNGQGVALAYVGTNPEYGVHEYDPPLWGLVITPGP